MGESVCVLSNNKQAKCQCCDVLRQLAYRNTAQTITKVAGEEGKKSNRDVWNYTFT